MLQNGVSAWLFLRFYLKSNLHRKIWYHDRGGEIISPKDLQEALKEKEKEILRLQADNTYLYQTVCTLNQTLNRMIDKFIWIAKIFLPLTGGHSYRLSIT